MRNGSDVSGWRKVAGIDGCPGGWLAVGYELDRGSSGATFHLFRSFDDALVQLGEDCLIAVDMPIGFPDRAEPGGRPCEREARAVLGARQSSVFATPARASLDAPDYRTACAINRAHSEPPKGLSKQCWNLFPKIREIDALISPALQARIKECHPELAFWVLNGCQALDTPKKVKSRPNPEGLTHRRSLLEAYGFSPGLLTSPLKAAEAGPDDLLDAAAIATTAERICKGQGTRFPHVPVAADAQGLAMEIWA